MPNQNQWSVFKRLLTYLKPYKFLTFLALCLPSCPQRLSRVLFPLWPSYFIDHYLHDMNHAASLILIVYYGLYLLQTLVSIWEISFLRVCPIVLSGIFAGMPLPIWRNWVCLTLTRLQQGLLFPA